jgi:hypothetical protein
MMASKHLVFLIHGMGTFSKTWIKPYVDALRIAYKQYDSLAIDPFDEMFEFEPVIYDDIFEDLRTQWTNNAKRVAKALVDNGFQGSAADRLVQIASEADGDDFVRTHVLDVILYRFMPTIGESVRNRVMRQIQQALKAYPSNDVPRHSVIAHSLGTAVFTESLHSWMSDGGWRDTPFAPRFRPDNVFMVANCSRILWSLGDEFYRNEVHPFPTEAKGACSYYGTYTHTLDPITHVKPFDPPPDRWFFPGVPRAEVYGVTDIHPEDIQQLNVHALEHYLAHPLVQIDIFRRMRGALSLVTEEEQTKALNAYYKTTLTGQPLSSARKRLGDFTLSDTESWSGILESIVAFRQLVNT